MQIEEGRKLYRIMPESGLSPASDEESDSLAALSGGISWDSDRAASFELQTLDEVSEDGMKLCALNPLEAKAINASDRPLRAVRVGRLEIEARSPTIVPFALGPDSRGHDVNVACWDSRTRAPIEGCQVIVLSDVSTNRGGRGRTGADGKVKITLDQPIIASIYVYKDPDYWGAYRGPGSVEFSDEIDLFIEPIDPELIDPVRHYFGGATFNREAGVLVGTVDTGVGPRSELNVSGVNVVPGEGPEDFSDVGDHGTFGAGLIGAEFAPEAGYRSLAPGVPIRAYRVFSKDMETNDYLVIKGIMLAVQDGCDVINLALGAGDKPNEDFARAIQFARNKGSVVVCGAGNGFRRPVSYPGRYPGALTVGALGRLGTFPSGSVIDADIASSPPSPTDPSEFIGAFSNMGPEVDLLSLGSGLVSILPNEGLGGWSGASVATPLASGIVACLLSQHPDILSMPRDGGRSDAIVQMARESCKSMGFPRDYEGAGLPRLS